MVSPGDKQASIETPLNQPDSALSAWDTHKVMVVLVLSASLAFAVILVPFFSPVLWGLIIALVSAPVFRLALRWTQDRRNLAAMVTLAGVVVVLVFPLLALALALMRETMGIVERLQTGEWNPANDLNRLFATLPSWVTALLDRLGLGSAQAIQLRVNTSIAQGMKSLALVAMGIGQDMFNFLAKLFIALYLAFFMIRDGQALDRTLRLALPLPVPHKRELFRIFATVLRATVKGHLVVAVVQGALGGLALWALDIHAALLWAVVMALMSLLPVVGSGLVWMPMALYLLAAGRIWQGVALMVYGMLVIGLVDNLLRPRLVGQDTRMPDYLVMVSTLGGLVVFGVNGLVLGPAIAAMFLAVWKIDIALRHPT